MQDTPWNDFLASWQPKFAGISKVVNQAFWLLETTGSKDAAEIKTFLDMQLKTLLSDAKTYEKLLFFQEQVKDPLERRMVDILLRSFKENQLPLALLQKIAEKESEIALEYASFRPKIQGKKVSENEIREILKNEREVSFRKKTWEVSKEIGARLAPKIVELVKYRNEAAEKLGYKNYFSLQLDLQEVEEKALFSLLKELSTSSKGAYDKLVEKIEKELCQKFQVTPSEIGPWAFSDPFCQEDPLEMAELDKFVKKIDMEMAAKSFFSDMGFSEVGILLENSDLYEREGKNQHAFCVNIDRKEDIRTLNNLLPSMRWMETLLHELGHGVYEQLFSKELPWLLRQPPHMIPTEAMALLCGRQAYLSEFLTKHRASSEQAIFAEESLKRRELIFSRWVLVMTYFERDLYQNPDQDLNALWWKYVEAFQKVKRPANREKACDWAAKYHIGLAPVYYFSYLLGEFFASSLQKKIKEKAGSLFTPYTKTFLEQELFSKGAALSWSDLITSCLKKPLSCEDWLEEFAQTEAFSLEENSQEDLL